jgi:hypothetical protein
MISVYSSTVVTDILVPWLEENAWRFRIKYEIVNFCTQVLYMQKKMRR